MALSLRQGRFYALKFDRKLVSQMLQWKCKCESKKFERDKFSGGDLGYFLSRTLTTMNSEKARTSFRVSTAQSVTVVETKDVKRKMLSRGLNEEQASAVETNDNYVRVVAGPGSGKTRVLTHRIECMVTCRNVSPSSVLCITFTNKAARELFERLNNMLDKNVSRQLTVGTIHSVCAKILRSVQVSDYHIDNNYTIYDDNDSGKVVKRILQKVVGCLDANKPLNDDPNLGISGQNMGERVMQRSESELLKDLARCKFFTRNAPERLELLHFLEQYYDTGMSEKKKSVPANAVKGLFNIINKARLYNMQTFVARKHHRSTPDLPYRLNEFGLKMADIYELELRRANAVDFDDLLYIAARLLHNNKHIREEYRVKWRHILVDEFQDIDEIQYELISLLSIGNQSLFVVGDIDQAIYAWRGANAAHMQYTLERDFPSITTFKLMRNYRSSRNILKVASVMLKNISSNRQVGTTSALNLLPVKPAGEPICVEEFPNAVEEADFVAVQIHELLQTELAKPSSCVILYRTHAQSFLFQSSLTSMQIPHEVIGSLHFYSHKEVRCVLAYLRLIGNSEDQMALERIINVPTRGSTMFLRSIDASSRVKNAKFLFETIEEVIREVGEDNVVQVVTDNAANYVAAGKLLMERHPKIFWTPCAAHCIDLMLEDIGKLVWVKSVVTQAKNLCKFIYNHALILSTMRQYTKGNELARPEITRFASNFITLKSLLTSRLQLRCMFVGPEWSSSSFATSPAGIDATKCIYDDEGFWEPCSKIVEITEPLVSLLRVADGEKPSMGYIYEGMDRVKEAIKAKYVGVEKNYDPIWDIINRRWQNQLHKPIHAAAYYLNPAYRFRDDFKADEEVLSGLYTVISKMSPNPTDILLEMDAYNNASGAIFSSAICKEGRTKLQPGIGEQTLAALKHWASERNLTLSSALKRIHTEGVNRKELKIKTNARAALLQFWELIEGFQNLIHTETIGTIIEAIIERTGFKTYLKNSETVNNACRKQLDRLSVLQTIGDSATQKHGTGKMALATFLQEISLQSDEENSMSNKDRNCVKLMTLHAAKGLEFDTVFITGLQRDLLPLKDADIDEERRLFYVGITRAIKRLYITFSRSIFRRGKTFEGKPSEFIKEILMSPELKQVQ